MQPFCDPMFQVLNMLSPTIEGDTSVEVVLGLPSVDPLIEDVVTLSSESCSLSDFDKFSYLLMRKLFFFLLLRRPLQESCWTH